MALYVIFPPDEWRSDAEQRDSESAFRAARGVHNAAGYVIQAETTEKALAKYQSQTKKYPKPSVVAAKLAGPLVQYDLEPAEYQLAVDPMISEPVV